MQAFLDDVAIAMQDIRTVWYRRPQHGQIAAGVLDPDDRSFCRQEWATTFDGLLLNLDARFVNPVLAEFAAVKPQSSAMRYVLRESLPHRAEVALTPGWMRMLHSSLTNCPVPSFDRFSR